MCFVSPSGPAFVCLSELRAISLSPPNPLRARALTRRNAEGKVVCKFGALIKDDRYTLGEPDR